MDYIDIDCKGQLAIQAIFFNGNDPHPSCKLLHRPGSDAMKSGHDNNGEISCGLPDAGVLRFSTMETTNGDDDVLTSRDGLWQEKRTVGEIPTERERARERLGERKKDGEGEIGRKKMTEQEKEGERDREKEDFFLARLWAPNEDGAGVVADG
ncbi:hypothetical protein ACLOJK_028131 [Asimina triloba]